MKAVTIYKRELCWIEHQYTWTEHDFNRWKEWLSQSNDNWYIAVYNLVKDMSWDEAVTRLKNSDDVKTSYDYKGEKCGISFLCLLEEAMSEDTWDQEGIALDCIDTDTSYRYEDVDEDTNKD